MWRGLSSILVVGLARSASSSVLAGGVELRNYFLGDVTTPDRGAWCGNRQDAGRF